MQKPFRYPIIGTSPEFPFFLNIRSDGNFQLKKVIEDGYSYYQATLISKIIQECKNKNNYKIETGILSKKKSLFSSFQMSNDGKMRTTYLISKKENPPLFKKNLKKGKIVEFKINFKYFSELYGKRITTAKEILQQDSFYQDQIFIDCFGAKEAKIFCYLLNEYKKNIRNSIKYNRNPFLIRKTINEIYKDSKRNIDTVKSKIKNITYRLFKKNIVEIENQETSQLFKAKNNYEINKQIKKLFTNKSTLPIGLFKETKRYRTKEKMYFYLDIQNIRNIQIELLKKKKILFDEHSTNSFFYKSLRRKYFKKR